MEGTNQERRGFLDCVRAKLYGDSQIVVALVLIAVAIGLCIIFRNQIYTIMNSLFNQIGNAINNLSNGVVNGT